MGCSQSVPAAAPSESIDTRRIQPSPPSPPPPSPSPSPSLSQSQSQPPALAPPKARSLPKYRSRESSPVRLILSITSNKPLDASDVVDHDPNSFDVAKDEIRRVRKLAAEFLIANAMNKSDTTADYFAASVEVDDDDEDIAEIVDGLRSEIADGLPAPPLRDNRSKQATREAVYDQQDLSNFVRVKIHKTPEVRSLIYDAIKPIALFETFADEEIMQIIDVFRPASFRGGEVVVRGGDVGNDFYVIESGKLIERVGGDATKSRSYKRGVTIGEMSLVFGSPSAATITADDDVRVWILERSMYISVISSIRQEQYQEKLRFIQNCVVGDVLFTDRFDFNRIEDFAIAAKVDNFEEGDVILREGDQVEMFYVVRSGTIARYKTKGGGDEVRMGIVEESKVFGTTSFIRGVGCPYTYRATGKVKVFYLTRHDFESIMGSVKDAFDNNTAMPSVRNTLRREASRGTIFTSSSLQSYKCDLDDLVFYNVLGRGAFGHVRLVQSKKTKRLFALKAQSKDNICRKRQEKHILNEFEIAMQVEHKTLLRIHCAMQDKKFVYFLLDLLPGGELYKLSKDKAFKEHVARFYAASVVLAFETLHDCMIAYRDLKPENIVLDKKGYGVLVDFGLAKEVEGLTYTFCGTPDYLSPEVIRRTGHNWAVDYWALGVFLYEMTKGVPPFFDRKPFAREKKILKGFDPAYVPPHFSSGLTDLISKLLITDQTKRLGRTQNGVQGIKNHRWFAGFDWEGFEKQSLKEVPFPPNLPQDIKAIGNVMDGRLKQEVDATPYSEWWPDLSLDTRFQVGLGAR